MLFKEIFGKTITDIYIKFSKEQEWLDVADCFIELNKGPLINIPFGPLEPASEIPIKILDPEAKSIFVGLSQIPPDHKNKWQRLKVKIKKIFRANPDDRIEHLLNRQIVDFIWFEDSDERGFLLLDNGRLITEILMAPHGTGHAGLHYYKSLKDLVERHGSNYKRFFH